MQKFKWLILICILIIAFFLRIINLSKTPPSLNWDEVNHAYNAYSLLMTGKDQWGQTLPLLNFRGFGDYPTTLNLYMTVPFISLGVRFPHVLTGVLTVLALFIAGYWWFRSYRVGLWVAFIAAISPWLLWPSRQIIQSNWAVLLASLGLAYYGRSKTTQALLIWALGLFAYHNFRIFLPLILITIMIFKKTFHLPLILLTMSIIILLSPNSRARSEWVGILNSGAVSTIENSRSQSQLPTLVSRFVYNRPMYFLETFFRNYLDYLDPRFIFLSGGTQYQFSIPGWGLIPWMVAPFFYWGVIKLSKQQRFLIAWLLLAIVPAAVTVDRWAVIRSTLMIPAVMLITGFCLFKLKNIYLKYLIIVAILMYTGFYSKAMLFEYSQKYSQSWQYGYKQAVQIIKEHYGDVDQVVFTKRYGEPHEFILWYWPWNPSKYQPNWDYHANWYWINDFDKFRFVNDWEMKNQTLKPKTLVISSPENESLGQEITRINFLDGKPAFIIKII